MKKDRPTVYEDAISRGITRRQFLTFCTTMAAYLGLEHSAVGQVVKALETKPKVPVLWFNFQECTCCTESFIRSSHPTMVDILFDKISLDYNETLMAAAGVQAEEALQNAMKEYKGEY
ncbi:MAG: [Ni/Fe] hydrogenase small subunit, partial [Tannerellaceae bacterium]